MSTWLDKQTEKNHLLSFVNKQKKPLRKHTRREIDVSFVKTKQILDGFLIKEIEKATVANRLTLNYFP